MATNDGTKYILEAMKRFPDSPALTLAKKVYKEHSKYFKSVHNVRNIIRYHRGQSGTENIKHLANKDLMKEAGAYNPFNLPEAVDENYQPFRIDNTNGIIISDLHFPYQHNQAITSALEYGLKKNVNFILINGDLLDFAQISRHEREWRQRSPYEEFESARQFLRELRKAFPKAQIVFKEGNHDERWEKWLYVKAPELFDDPEFQLEVRLKLGELKIEIVKDRRPVSIGKLNVLHGHEMAGSSGGVNPARATFLKTLDNVLVGHYHRTSSHVEATFGGDVISVQSVGCLCTLNPYYMRVNKHNHGFAHIEHDFSTGEYHLENLKIIKGKVY
jgi:predicted phosphodiesterase